MSSKFLENSCHQLTTRWKCVCTYEGDAFCGWQSQANGCGVQDVLEKRLQEIFGHFIRIHGSGRTDAGVHALGQIFHFDAHWSHSLENLQKALNVYLSPHLQIISIQAVGSNFHARFSALGKQYDYHMLLRPPTPFEWRYYGYVPLKKLNLTRLKKAAKNFIGTHNFSAFSKKVQPNEHTIKQLLDVRVNTPTPDHIHIEVLGSGFLYQMVRKIVGALIFHAEGKLSLDSIKTMLATGKKIARIPTAPPQGLFLKEVFYK